MVQGDLSAYGIRLAGEWTPTGKAAVLTAAQNTAGQFHRVYLSHHLADYTAGRYPAAYPRPLDLPALFRTAAGEVELLPTDEQGALRAFGEAVDRLTWSYGSARLKASGQAGTWGQQFARWVGGAAQGVDDTLIFVLLASRLASESVPATPDRRVAATRHFYSQDGFGFGGPPLGEPFNEGLGYGRSQLDFTLWEVHRGVLNLPDDPDKPGSRWWRAANGQIMRDMEEARILTAGGAEGGANPAVGQWIRYITDPTPQTWYAAHDTSVMLGYLDFTESLFQETFEERVLITSVLTRLMLAQALVTARTNHALGDTPLDELIEELLQDISVPEGIAVDLIVNVGELYPHDYPLRPFEKISVMFWYLVTSLIFRQGPYTHFADVNITSVLRRFLRTFPPNIVSGLQAALGR